MCVRVCVCVCVFVCVYASVMHLSVNTEGNLLIFIVRHISVLFTLMLSSYMYIEAQGICIYCTLILVEI